MPRLNLLRVAVSESQLCAGVECIESNSELKSTELQLCAEVGFIETNSTLTSGNFSDSQLSAELESNSNVTSDVPNEVRSSTDIEMSSGPKFGEPIKLQLCGEVELREINMKPGESRESQLSAMVKPEVKLLRATHLPACHAKVVQAQISANVVNWEQIYVCWNESTRVESQVYFHCST